MRIIRIALFSIVLLLVATLGWAYVVRAEPTTSRPPAVTARSHHDATISIPPSWQLLERDDTHSVWGSTDRRHTVTLAVTQSSDASLPRIVAAIRADSQRLVGAQPIGTPRSLTLKHARRRDSAVLATYVIPRDGKSTPPIELVQIWRRDFASQRDVVATWTSDDGHWPIDPRLAIPEVTVR